MAVAAEGGRCGIITGFANGIRTLAVHSSAPISSPGEDLEPLAGTGYFGVTAAAQVSLKQRARVVKACLSSSSS